MSTTDAPQTCGADTSPEYSMWFECELLPGHAGEHQAVYTWSNEPHGPELPPPPPTAHTQWLHAVYDKMMAQQLASLLNGSPFIDGDCVMQIVNRDSEMMQQ